MAINLIDKITNRENLYWAWEKTKFFYKPGDVWFDEIEIAGFEANLEQEFNSIIKDIRKGNYLLHKIKPIGFPKSPDNEGNLRTRQTFWVSVRDQVTWIAIINIIGPYLDEQMPFWSYGNRLYISVFYDKDDAGNKAIRFGHYRNTSKHLLRKWNQSWPMFRKHIALTIKKMCNQPLDADEKELEETNRLIRLKQLHCGYLDDGFWNRKKSTDIFWASIDFEKFYPSAKIQTVRENIIEYLPQDQINEIFLALIKSLTTFEIDSSGWNSEDLKKSLQIESTVFENIPTGLFAAHFLANILLLKTDLFAHKAILERGNIAHFRFVDDHIILCDNFEDLTEWIELYKEELDKHTTGAKINYEKTEPSALKEFLVGSEDDNLFSKQKDEAIKSCKLDPEYPSPLMTQTLAKISKINETEFDLLDNDDKDRFIADIEHLLLAEFNEQEIRKDTRLSFAATILTRLVPKIIIDNSEIIKAETDLANLSFDLVDKTKKARLDQEEEQQFLDVIIDLKKKIGYLNSVLEKRYDLLYEKTYKILQKVVYENFDKVRLWNRAMEFCFNTGYNGVGKLFELIDKLANEKKASKLTLIFIESLILQVLSNLALRAAKNITDPNTTHLQKNKSQLFLESLNEPEFLQRIKKTDGKFYHTKAINLFEKTLEVVHFTINENSKISFVDSSIANSQLPVETYDYYSSNVSSWIWWFNAKLSLDYYSPSKLWLESINKIPFDNSVSISLALLYPKSIPFHVFSKLENSITNDGWLFDLIKNNDPSALKNYTTFPRVVTVFDKLMPLSNYLTLYDWNIWLETLEMNLHNKYYKNDQGYYDTRISEWTSLEIVRQITELLIPKLEEPTFGDEEITDLKYVHPNNYLIPDEWVTEPAIPFSWHEWERISLNTIKLNNIENFIKDERFSPVTLDPFGQEDAVESAILGIGALLTCLLSRDFNLPAYWNSDGHRRAWLNLIYSKLKATHISSLTKQLLDSIFSKRNKETRLLNIFFPDLEREYEFSEDTLIDPPEITTLKELSKFIAASQKVLKSYRLNIQDNMPRQLIPVSLKQLTQQYQPYKDEEEQP